MPEDMPVGRARRISNESDRRKRPFGWVDLVRADTNRETYAEKEASNSKRISKVKYYLLCGIKSTIESIISENSNISNDEIVKNLASKETIDTIINKAMKTGADICTEATVKSVYYDILLEYVIQSMVNKAKESDPSIVLSLHKTATVNTKDGKVLYEKILRRAMEVMNEADIVQNSIKRKIRTVIESVTKRELDKLNVRKSEPEDIDL